MGAPRRVGPAAVAAALIAAGLALHRPRLVPELKAGPRAAPRPPAAELASPIAWPAAPRPVPPPPAARAPAAEVPAPSEAIAAWRDALADRPFAPVERAGAAVRPAPSASGPSEGSPAAAGPLEPRSLHEAVVGLLRAAARRAPSASSPPRVVPARGAAHARPGAARRVPFAVGPAWSEGAAEEDGPAAVPVPGLAAGPGGSWSRRRARSFPLFRPSRRGAGSAPGSALRRRVRPLLLSRLLGPGALRPPPASVVPPDLSGLVRRRPMSMPDGAPVPARPYELDRIEAHDPRRSRAADRRRAPHWDAGPRWHDGAAVGIAADARWLWLWKEKTRVWAVGEPGVPPLLRHRELWWGKQKGVWFAVHDGALWSWRRFSDWDAEGLIRLADGVELVYSADFTKVAVITPGAGAVLYDARSGAELGEWLEEEMPRRRPRAPAGLRLPRGI